MRRVRGWTYKKCEYCGRLLQSLGYASHRAACWRKATKKQEEKRRESGGKEQGR